MLKAPLIRRTGTTTVLAGLRTLAAVGRAAADARTADALDLLEAKRGEDGSWRPEGKWWKRPGSKGSNVEVVDWGTAANELLTEQAEGVLGAAGRGSRVPTWRQRRILILGEGFSHDPHYGKTMRGIIRYGPDPVVAILDSARAGEMHERDPDRRRGSTTRFASSRRSRSSAWRHRAAASRRRGASS